jgi:hypothetical protein
MKSALRGGRVAWLAFAFVPICAVFCTAQSDDVCDHAIEKLKGSGKLAYTFVGPQCEGTYDDTTGGDLDLRLAGLTRSVPRADFRAVPALDLAWYPPKAADVRIRAASTRYKYYYRMDAHPASVSTFHWRTSLLQQTDLSMPEIGLLAWTRSSALGTSQVVYLPIKVITAATSSARTENLVLSVIPSVDLDEVTWQATRLGAPGSRDTIVPGGGPLRLGYYPHHKSIAIPIDLGARSGYFRIDVSVRHEGASLVRSYAIYVPR